MDMSANWLACLSPFLVGRPLAHMYPSPMNGTECNRHNVTEQKGNFRSVQFGWKLPSVIF
uniref:Uncharacterized protein n=1 Tax=Romanomermis culicivorax TaxID=13658 RepID=A0A915J1K8_ROMCU